MKILGVFGVFVVLLGFSFVGSFCSLGVGFFRKMGCCALVSFCSQQGKNVAEFDFNQEWKYLLIQCPTSAPALLTVMLQKARKCHTCTTPQAVP